MGLSDLRKSVGNVLYRQVGRANGQVQNHRSLPVDVLENETTYQVVFDAPGAEPDDLQVRYLDGNVKIRIDRFRQYHEGYEMRFPGRGMELEGEAELPDDAVVDPDSGTATLTETGTLRIDIPKDSSIEGDETEVGVDVESDADTDSDTDAPAEADLTADD